LCLYLFAWAQQAVDSVEEAETEAEAPSSISADARQDVVNRLTENVFMGACKYSLQDPREAGAFRLTSQKGGRGLSAWDKATAATTKSAEYSSAVEMTVYMYPPSAVEVERQKQLPATITGANVLLGTSPRAVRWAANKEVMWQIPSSHPRQNKHNCLDYSRQAGEGPAAFYTNDSVIHANTFYVMQLKGPTIVHEVGLVATKCGWVQAVEACETHYKFIGRRWHAACLANLTAQQSSWEGMFATTPIPIPIPIPVAPMTTKRPEGEQIRSAGSVEADADADADAEAEAERKREQDSSQSTLVDTVLSHVCFPAEVIRPGRKQIAAGVKTSYVYKQVRRVKRVFVISSQWDNNFHHFVVDCLSRVTRHLNWLKENPDVYIHIRAFERLAKKDRYISGGRLLRRGFWDLLGVSPERIIYGNVLADVVWLPRSTRCNEPLASAMEQRLLSSRLIAAAGADVEAVYSDTSVDVGGFSLPLEIEAASTDSTQRRLAATATDDLVDDDKGQGHAMPAHQGLGPSSAASVGSSSAGGRGGGVDGPRGRSAGNYPQLKRPLLVIQHRVCSVEEDCAKTWREFSEETQQRMTRAFRVHYGDNYRIVVVSSNNTQLMSCIACQIRLYRQADVLVGLHGAGLTHIMFMKPGSVLIEATGEFDGRMAPVCGYHGPLAAIYGVHHYLFMWEWRVQGKRPPTDDEFADLAEGAYQFGLKVGSK